MTLCRTAAITLLMCVLLPAANAASTEDCENLVKMDGLLSKARQECPFSYYNFRFQQASRLCGEKTGDAQWKKLFAQGASAFDGKASSMGKPALCAKLAKDFPMTVKF